MVDGDVMWLISLHMLIKRIKCVLVMQIIHIGGKNENKYSY